MSEDPVPTSKSSLAGGWIFLNIDDAVQLDSGNATTGGVLRDEKEEWILGYNKFLDKCSVFDAEL